MPPLATSLSARVLFATILFVMLAEVLIFAPSVGRFREHYLQHQINGAHLATLVLSTTDEYMITETLRQRLLDTVEAHGIVVSGAGFRGLVVARDMPPLVAATIDLNETELLDHVIDSFAVFMHRGNRALRVIGHAPGDPGLMMEVVIDERPLRREIMAYAGRIAGLSMAISLFTGVLLFGVLQWFFVRPLRQTTESMVMFRAAPEDRRSIIDASNRRDEIGIAQRELARMQRQVTAALRQKARLAALGTAVTKINHDLRNILSTASVVSESLAGSEHPEVRRAANRLVAAIDRAATLCSQTLDYARSGVVGINPRRFALTDLVAEVGQDIKSVAGGRAAWRNTVAADLVVEADRGQLSRVIANLGCNAIEAGAKVVTISAAMGVAGTVIEIADDGPGLADGMRERLFKPFAGGGRAGGTGLGLAIAREIVHAHGGELSLASSSGAGTVFRLALPAAGERPSPRSRSVANG